MSTGIKNILGPFEVVPRVMKSPEIEDVDEMWDFMLKYKGEEHKDNS